MARGAAGPSSGQSHRELPGGWSRAPCHSNPGLRVVLPLGETDVSPGVAQDHEYLNPTQSPAGQRLTVPIFLTRTPPGPPDPQDEGVESPCYGSTLLQVPQSPQPGQVLLARMRVRVSMNKADVRWE